MIEPIVIDEDNSRIDKMRLRDKERVLEKREIELEKTIRQTIKKLEEILRK